MNRQRVTYTPTGGVCSKIMIVDSEDNVIKNVQIETVRCTMSVFNMTVTPD